MKKSIFVGLIVLFVSACSTQQKVVEKPVEVVRYKTVEVPAPKPIIPHIEPVKMRPLKWSVINQDDNTYFALDKYGYEALSLNLNDIRAYMQKTQKVMESYR